MKKIFTFAIVAMLALGGAKAQVNFHLGALQNQVTSINHLVNAASSSTTAPGLYAGFSFNIDLNHNFGLLMGINGEYILAKDTLSIMNMAGVERTATQVDVDVPFLLNYTLHFGRKVGLTIFGGATLNYAILNRMDYKSNILGVTNSWTEDGFTTNDFNQEGYIAERYSWGLSYGARLFFGKVGIHGVYYYGMTDLNDNANIEAQRTRISLGLDVNF